MTKQEPNWLDIAATVSNDGIYTITMKREKQRNAFRNSMLLEMKQAIERANANQEVMVIVLCSNSEIFCAGVDLHELRSAVVLESYRKKYDDPIGHIMDKTSELLNQLAQSEKPIVSVVNGKSVGSGATLLAVSDYVIASEARAEVAYPEVKFAQRPLMSLPHVQRKVVSRSGAKGLAKLRQVFDSGGTLSASEAKEIGIHDKLFSNEGHQFLLQETVNDLRRNGFARVKLKENEYLETTENNPTKNSPMIGFMQEAHEYFLDHGNKRGITETYRKHCLENWCNDIRDQTNPLETLEEYIEQVTRNQSNII